MSRVIDNPIIRRVKDHPRQVLMDFSPSRTKQAPAEACDVNSIMARYARTGVLPVMRMQGAYADVSGLSGFDYGQAQELLQRCNDAFMLLPAEVRASMDNDPAKFVQFVQDPANRDKAVELGLIAKAPVEPEKVG